VVIEPRPIVFQEDGLDMFEGAPLIEMVLDAFVGRCQGCGMGAGGQLAGSVLMNALAVDGTLYGDTFCTGCYENLEEDHDGPVFFLPPLD
jgi:hypothetical protein